MYGAHDMEGQTGSATYNSQGITILKFISATSKKTTHRCKKIMEDNYFKLSHNYLFYSSQFLIIYATNFYWTVSQLSVSLYQLVKTILLIQ